MAPRNLIPPPTTRSRCPGHLVVLRIPPRPPMASLWPTVKGNQRPFLDSSRVSPEKKAVLGKAGKLGDGIARAQIVHLCYSRLIKAIQGPRFQIGNNRGRINGWVSARAIFGKCGRVED